MQFTGSGLNAALTGEKIRQIEGKGRIASEPVSQFRWMSLLLRFKDDANTQFQIGGLARGQLVPWVRTFCLR